jgi:hypothetical protein
MYRFIAWDLGGDHGSNRSQEISEHGWDAKVVDDPGQPRVSDHRERIVTSGDEVSNDACAGLAICTHHRDSILLLQLRRFANAEAVPRSDRVSNVSERGRVLPFRLGMCG